MATNKGYRRSARSAVMPWSSFHIPEPSYRALLWFLIFASGVLLEADFLSLSAVISRLTPS